MAKRTGIKNPKTLTLIIPDELNEILIRLGPRSTIARLALLEYFKKEIGFVVETNTENQSDGEPAVSGENSSLANSEVGNETPASPDKKTEEEGGNNGA